MALVSRPIAYTALAAVVASAIFLLGGDGPSPVSRLPRKRLAKAADAGWDFPPPDPKLLFPKPKAPSRNPFVALVQPEAKGPIVTPPKEKPDLVGIPANLAGGEGGWAYTGWAAVDGVPMALLENATSRQSGYVRVGEAWKAAHVVAITNSAITMADDKGRSETVFRFNPNDPPKVKPAPEGGFQPPLGGPINGRLGLQPLNPPSPGGSRTVRFGG